MFSVVDMLYDSDEEVDYSKMDLVGLILIELYFKIFLIDINFFLVYCICIFFKILEMIFKIL